MSLARGTRLGTYEVLGAIGAGGMGEVYRAREQPMSRLPETRVVAMAPAAGVAPTAQQGIR